MGTKPKKSERIINHTKFRLKILLVAQHLQACSGQRAQPAQAGGYPYIFHWNLQCSGLS